jgi:lipopolysaccharide export LptBFGC system permease protein LptF
MIMWAHRRPSITIAVVLLLIIAIAHVLRIFYHTSVMVNTVTIPAWVSLPAVIVTGGLAIWLWMENRKE